MSCNNGKLGSLDENRVPVVFVYDSPFSTLRYFHCLASYPAARWYALNFPQHSQVNTHDARYGGVGGDGGHDKRGEQSAKKNFALTKISNFVALGNSAALVIKSGIPNLGFG
jgi:hypothetical protein